MALLMYCWHCLEGCTAARVQGFCVCVCESNIFGTQNNFEQFVVGVCVGLEEEGGVDEINEEQHYRSKCDRR